MFYDECNKTYVFKDETGEILVKIEKEICFVLFFKIYIKKESKHSLNEAINFLEEKAKEKKCKAIAYHEEDGIEIKGFHTLKEFNDETKFWFNNNIYIKLLAGENFSELETLFYKINKIKDLIKTFDPEESIQIKKITVEIPFLMFRYFNESFGIILNTENGKFVLETISNEKTEQVFCNNLEEAIKELMFRLEKIYKKNRFYKLFGIKKID